MSHRILVAPSILACDFSRLGEEVQAVESAGADWIHVDVMDGHFVPNISLGAPVIKSLRPVTGLPLDVHLMIDRPERYIKDFIDAGADFLTIHVESTENTMEVLKEIRRLGARPGISLRPQTDIEQIIPFLELVDLVLVMTVNPGFGGQSFLEDQLSKVNVLRDRLKDISHKVYIEVDGGVNLETAKLCKGVDVLVAGSYIFKQKGFYQKAIESLKEM